MPTGTKSQTRQKSDKQAKSDAAGRRGRNSAKPATPQSQAGDAVSLLEQDHRQVEALFAQFEQANGDAAKRQAIVAVCAALKVHARVEEDLFYPAVASVLGAGDLIQEAQVEHASAKDLISQIETGAPGEPLFDARVKVLAEYVAHHVREEEGEIFPRCRKGGIDLDLLGSRIAFRKQELMLGLTMSNPVQGLS